MIPVSFTPRGHCRSLPIALFIDCSIQMDATSAAAAQCHYQSGCYKDALLVLEWQPLCEPDPQPHCLGITDDSTSRQLDGWITADDPPVKPVPLKFRAELAALPNLARHADISMCRFRSALHSSPLADKISHDRNDGEATPLLQLWKEATQTNSRYRKTLSAAAASLLNTCFAEMEFIHRIKNQSVSTSTAAAQQRSAEHISIQNALKSTSISILMAGIACAHLNLHEVELQQETVAWNVLVQCAVMAGELLHARREFMQCISCEETKVTQNTSSLESSLSLINDTLKDERSAVALHSFRTALKVAALACGKLILPFVDVQFDNYAQEPVKKKQKKLNGRSAGKLSDIWNAKYVDGNTALHCREQLVDAISFHSALVHCTGKAKQTKPTHRSALQTTINYFFSKREACFNDAIQGEAKMKAFLTFKAQSMAAGDVTGYACNVYNCLRALELSDKSFQPILCRNDDRSEAISVLEKLASASTSRFACECMGCIHAQNGEYSRAIEMFQLALERCEKSSEENLVNSDIEVDREIAERRILSSMAACFVAQGGAATALEMLLTVWSRLNETTEASTLEPRPKSFLFLAGSKELETTSLIAATAASTARTKLLWMICHVSSLVGDWPTCLDSTELLKQCTSDEDNPRVHVDIANAFVLLQCGRERESREVIQELITKLTSLDSNHQQTVLTSIIADIFSAEISLTYEPETDDPENEFPFLYISRAADSLNTSTFNTKPDIRSLLELRVLVLNDHGISCLTEGDSARAMCCFRDALELIAPPNDNRSWLLLPVHFNLALLLFRDGRIDESAKVWLSIRGHLSTWESAKRNDPGSLAKLRDSHLLSMNRHGMVMARRNKTGATADQKVNSSWVAPILPQEDWTEELAHVNGVDAEQVCTLDFVLLKHALSTAEKKCNSTFLRRGAPFGY